MECCSWRACPQQKSSCFIKEAQSYGGAKIAFSFFLPVNILTGVTRRLLGPHDTLPCVLIRRDFFNQDQIWCETKEQLKSSGTRCRFPICSNYFVHCQSRDCPTKLCYNIITHLFVSLLFITWIPTVNNVQFV